MTGAPKQTTPLVGELVIANISKIMPFGAYCKLPEYNNLEVFLPIKEVSSGWIKNIHEYIHEGQKVVCKVVYFDKERQTLDVSIKKVTPQDSKNKINIYNLEKRLSGMFMQGVKQAGLDAQKDDLSLAVIAEFRTYTELMRNATDDTPAFVSSKLPKKLKDTLMKLLETSKKKKRYIVSYIMKLSTFNTKSGATELREILTTIKGKGVEVLYIGAPRYRLSAEGKDYNDAEGKIKAAQEVVTAKLKKGVFEIEKEKLKKDKEDIMATL